MVLTKEYWPKARRGKKEPGTKVRIARRDLLVTPGCVSGTMSHNTLWITKFADCTSIFVLKVFLLIRLFKVQDIFYKILILDQIAQENEEKHQAKA